MTVNFIVGLIFSFLGSIPPGAVNLSVLQLSVENRIHAAFRFALAAMLVEIPYAIFAIQFQELITQSPFLLDNFRLIAALLLIGLGIGNILSNSSDSSQRKRWTKIRESGFRKGLIVGLFNPMAIPFWIGVTAYLHHEQWITLPSWGFKSAYIAGLALGTFLLLSILILLSKKLAPHFRRTEFFQYIPGIAFLLLGFYSLLRYFHVI